MKITKFSYNTLIFLTLIANDLRAQKPALTLASFENWSNVSSGAITNDGKYIQYAINNVPLGSRTLILQESSLGWKKELPGIEDCSFTDDSRQAIYMVEDTLCLLKLGTEIKEEIANVVYYRLFRQAGHEILAVQKTAASNNELLLNNLFTGKVQSFPNVTFSTISTDTNAMLIHRSIKDDTGKLIQTIYHLDLLTWKALAIWKGKGHPGNFIFDGAKQVAFVVTEEPDKQDKKSIFLWQAGNTQARILDPITNGETDRLQVDVLTNFTKDGTRLFLKLREPEPPKAKPGAVKVDVWSYTDPKLQSHQLNDLESSSMIFYGAGVVKNSYAAVIEIKSKKRIQLGDDNEYVENLFNALTDDWQVLKKNQGGGYMEAYWNRTSKPTFYLMSTKNGKKRPLTDEIYNLSPDGKYALGFDKQTNLFSYELSTGIRRDLSSILSLPMGDGGNDLPSTVNSFGLSIVGWLSDSKSILVYDKYDIWKLDPLGNKRPINLTNGYGRKHKIAFRFVEEINGKAIAKNQQLVLAAFNRASKENGFYRLTFGKGKDPEKLTMGPYVYSFSEIGLGIAPIKARGAAVYLVQRESAAESPNYFLTRDFKRFKQLSAIYPEKQYNWMLSELVNFKTVDGKDEQGALYKPEDFDPGKKYPVIIHYYERKTDGTNSYHRPGAISDEINIPWFVSHGYLVFTPDIHYTIGQPGQSAYNSVVGAANHLKTFPFVDGTQMGIQGHSFGGYETNYIVAHTNVFAAAMSSSGFSNLVSSYGAVMKGGGSNYFSYWAEVIQGRIGSPLLTSPNLYVNNSPIFCANKITTPLMMMNNIEDGIVNFSQGVELFTALRRLGKRAWMLQYDGQKHSVLNPKAKLDYTVRMTQFFDHYLKGAAAPLWMLRGIPAKLKGVDDGLALDTTGATPGPGLLIETKKMAN